LPDSFYAFASDTGETMNKIIKTDGFK